MNKSSEGLEEELKKLKERQRELESQLDGMKREPDITSKPSRQRVNVDCTGIFVLCCVMAVITSLLSGGSCHSC